MPSRTGERVSLVTCEAYEPGYLRRGVARAFDLLDGPQSFMSPGDSVFVKVNCVMAVGPDTAIVTNPELVSAVVTRLLEVTDSVTVGDSPGGPFTRARLEKVYEKTGIADVARRTGARLAMDTSVKEVPLPGGARVKRLSLCRSMVEADHMVSVSKFKTHRYMNVTGPIKNLYGSVPGLTKFVYHSRFDSQEDFADLVVDVHLAAAPSFHVVDAVDTIDGDGSRHGRVRRMKVIAAGANAFALESLMIDLAGLAEEDSRPLAAAVRRGVCPSGAERWYTVLGDSVADLRLPDFQLPGSNYFSERTPALMTGRLSRFTTVTPKPLAGKCTGCGTCAAVCPSGAIQVSGGTARVDPGKCIRCFCCDELCEYQAMGLREPVLVRIRGRRSERRSAF